MDPFTLAMAGGSVLQGLGSLFGAHSADKAAQQNFKAQQAQQGLVNNQAMGMMQTGQNPYAAMVQQLMGNNPSLYSFQPQSAPQAQMPGFGPVSQASASQVGSPMMVTGTQGQNAGQDALMQMMRRDIGGGPSQFLTNQLQNMGAGNSQFDNSDLFKALAPMDNQLLNEQVSQLQGSAGSLGRRFGTAMNKNEAMLRGNFASNIAARNAGIQQQSFENAQNRGLSALGQLGQQEQFYGQMPFQNAALQLQAAQSAGQLGQGQQGFDLQAALANQNAQLQQGTTNAQLGTQVGLANTGAQNAWQQFITGAGLQNNQFNAANQMQNNQFNAGMGMQGNQQLLQMLGLGNQFQNQQQQNNMGLLGIMAGQGVPQQQGSQMPGALGDVGGMAMLMPFLSQMYNQNRGGGNGQSPSTYGNNFLQYNQGQQQNGWGIPNFVMPGGQ